MKEYILSHREWGIYLGSAYKIAYWSRIDCSNLPKAATWVSPAEAREFTRQLGGEPEEFTITPVIVAEQGYASPEECEAAGLKRWNPKVTVAPYLN
jgi:hypothetical protein